MRQEAQGAEPVVDRHQDDAAAGPFFSVHRHLIAIAVHVGAAVNPHGDGQFGVRLAEGGGRRPDIQVQAVFAFLRCAFPVEFVSVEGPGLVAGLRSDGTESVADAHSFPGCDGLW